MTEEEKKAIEDFKFMVSKDPTIIWCASGPLIVVANTILNLIEKQQKEIERLNKCLDGAYDESIH